MTYADLLTIERLIDTRFEDAIDIAALVAEVRRLRNVLRQNVRGSKQTGYYVTGVWFSCEPFSTRAAAEAAYLDFVARNYGEPKEEADHA